MAAHEPGQEREHVMTTVTRTRQGQEARRAYGKLLAKRNANREMTRPTVVDALDSDGLIPAAKLLSPIKVEIPQFDLGPPNAGFHSELTLEWKRVNEDEFRPVSRMERIENDGTITFPLERVIERTYSDGQEGQFLLRYHVVLWNENDDWSDETRLRIRRTAPYRDRPYPDDTPPFAIVTTPVTEATLTADGGVECEIPDFTDPDRDRIIVAIGWSDVLPNPNDPVIPVITVPLPPDRMVTIPRPTIEPLRSGLYYLSYVLVDPAGNVSNLARVLDVPVALGRLPINPHPHSVPLAADGLINRADAFFGVTVDIPRYDDHESTDKIFVKWGNSELQSVEVGEVPPSVISVPVSWQRLTSQYNYTAGGVQITPVSYWVERAPTVDFRPTPPSINVNVDFSASGPIDDDDPNPVTPALDEVLVTSFSGLENKLGAVVDFGKDATATFDLPDPVVEGDTFTLYWNGVAIADNYVADSDSAPGDPVSLDILWSEILIGGPSDALPVYYALSNDDFPNNDLESVTTPVLVEAIPIVPNPPVFTDLTGNLLNCSVLRRIGTAIGYRVNVPLSSYLVPGEQITLHWRAFESNGTTPVPGTNKDSPITLPDPIPTTGIDWFVEPYATHILPIDPGSGIRSGWAEIYYTVQVSGTPRDSEKTRKVVSISLGSPGDTCDLADVPTP
ncbi:hypothetical protein [Pseudomonas batumici]|uniref:Uncharacterized protein n=1 Tax=Pseudomonas batumici TaxID=226910 RepID=A0A0C2F067_9PSED|nr:hypothetical protein [Pseudomonas batumici]KIH84483.1 hypothetical protein UCMB321_1714 [Pseudomonas batumici]